MAKITLQDSDGPYVTQATGNANNTLIETAMENTLSRDGTSPNQMGANLDMNSHRVLNLPEAVSGSEPATLSQLEDLVIESSALTHPQVTVEGNIVTWGNTSGTDIEDSGKAIPSGEVVGTTDSQTLTNKSISGSSNTLTNIPSANLTGTISVNRFNNGTGASATTALFGDGTWKTPGDVVGPASSVSGRLASYNGTTGKLIQDSGKAAPSGDIVGTTDSQTLSNKTLTAPVLGVATATSISFGGDPLSVYETNNWVPADASGAGLTFSSVTATWTRIGRVVFIQCNLTYPATGSGAAATFSGLPFTVATGHYGTAAINSSFGTPCLARFSSAGTTVEVLSAGNTSVTNAQLTGATVRFTGFYFV